ncbi:hypothetical protein J8I87_25700 [Paraburkholderia sp. LEh10]|jgi:hypothetical protein|uniref:hypothetical protein n=1 Tax=Paraburkholderia sp. LEh10 TaxID=2821353 RepID=UPI001AE7909C|nr:hypothetical protein [Paraburkholderia sp. LEh10]MBP0593052.1 hypothetical protein [Paraburkholderia sp. LEh10]
MTDMLLLNVSKKLARRRLHLLQIAIAGKRFVSHASPYTGQMTFGALEIKGFAADRMTIGQVDCIGQPRIARVGNL